jgi:hypothetical protein
LKKPSLIPFRCRGFLLQSTLALHHFALQDHIQCVPVLVYIEIMSEVDQLAPFWNLGLGTWTPFALRLRGMVLKDVQGISVLSYPYDLVSMFNVGSTFYLTIIGCHFLSARSPYARCSSGDRRQLPEAVPSL